MGVSRRRWVKRGLLGLSLGVILAGQGLSARAVSHQVRCGNLGEAINASIRLAHEMRAGISRAESLGVSDLRLKGQSSAVPLGVAKRSLSELEVILSTYSSDPECSSKSSSS